MVPAMTYTVTGRITTVFLFFDARLESKIYFTNINTIALSRVA